MSQYQWRRTLARDACPFLDPDQRAAAPALPYEQALDLEKPADATTGPSMSRSSSARVGGRLGEGRCCREQFTTNIPRETLDFRNVKGMETAAGWIRVKRAQRHSGRQLGHQNPGLVLSVVTEM